MSNFFKLIMGLLILAMFTGCATEPGKKTAVGAGIGAVVGAGVGAIVGHRSGNRDKGALIGATVGGIFGGVAGNRLDKQAKELAAIAETRRTDNGIVTKLNGDILFDTNKYDLRPKADESIAQIAGIIKKYPEDRLRVVGHTDNTGGNEINAELSRKRAEAVKNRLIAGGVPAEVITSYGMGQTQPIASNSTKDGRQLNRRVEIEITVDPNSVPKNAAN